MSWLLIVGKALVVLVFWLAGLMYLGSILAMMGFGPATPPEDYNDLPPEETAKRPPRRPWDEQEAREAAHRLWREQNRAKAAARGQHPGQNAQVCNQNAANVDQNHQNRN